MTEDGKVSESEFHKHPICTINDLAVEEDGTGSPLIGDKVELIECYNFHTKKGYNCLVEYLGSLEDMARRFSQAYHTDYHAQQFEPNLGKYVRSDLDPDGIYFEFDTDWLTPTREQEPEDVDCPQMWR